MKIRLARGPFNGKVIEAHNQNEIVVSGPKRMTHRQELECLKSAGQDYFLHKPFVEARYRIVMLTPSTPAQYVDGSVFFEYINGSKRERNV